MSTPATGPDDGTYDEQGVGDGAGRNDSAATAADHPGVEGSSPGQPYTPPYSGSGSGSGSGEQDHGQGRAPYPPAEQTPYEQGPYQQGPYPPAYQQGPYPPAQQGPYPQGPYPQGQHQQAPYAHAPYGPGGYNQGPFGQPYAPQKSRVVAGLLGILLGSLGIHRFYLGFTTIGIVLILMSTVGAVFTFGLSAIAAGIWGLVEGIMILVGAEPFRRDAQGIPLKD